MTKIYILIPIYNDWESVSKLIKEINFCIKDLEAEFSIIVINNASNNQQFAFGGQLNNGIGTGGSGDSGVPTSRGYSRGGERPDENGEPGLVVIF